MNLMAQTNFRGDDHQRGAVLVVGLIMLVVITLFVISMIKTSSIELKIGGISHIEALNFSNADLALNNFISLNNGQFAPGFLSIPAGSPGYPQGCSLPTCGTSNPPNVYGGSVTVIPVQLACGNDSSNGMEMGQGGLQVVQFDISSTATQVLGGSTTLHSGVQTSVLSCL